MRNRTRFCALAFVATVVAATMEGAVAQTALRSFTIGHWNAGAYARDGRFTHCSASVSNAETAMLFSIDRQYRWSLDLKSRDWRLVRGTVFDLAFAIDNGQVLHARARALNPTQASIQLADSIELFDRFRRGHLLRVFSTDGHVSSFNLDGSSAMLAQLHDCVRRYTRPANVANASDGKRPMTTNATLENPALQAEAAVLLANVMSAANVTGYAMGTPEEALKRAAHAVWTAPSVVGRLLIIPTRRVNDPEIPGLVTGINAIGCKGAFMSGSMPSDGRTVRVTTTCQPPDQPMTTSYYFGIPRPRGGLYLFITETTRDGRREDAERADEDIRRATVRTVN